MIYGVLTRVQDKLYFTATLKLYDIRGFNTCSR